ENDRNPAAFHRASSEWSPRTGFVAGPAGPRTALIARREPERQVRWPRRMESYVPGAASFNLLSAVRRSAILVGLGAQGQGGPGISPVRTIERGSPAPTFPRQARPRAAIAHAFPSCAAARQAAASQSAGADPRAPAP